jgi:SAM-dependent methyltransferase
MLHGVDIGSSLFGENNGDIDLRSHNVIEPFPGSFGWEDSFDVIHQRLLIWGIKSVEWPRVIRNYLEILKPGGYVQLVEAEWIDPARPTTLPQLKKQALLQEWSTKEFGMDIHVAYQLEGFLHDAGFEGVQKVQFDHGYGAKAKDSTQGDVSAELWVECFRTLDTKIGCKIIFMAELKTDH